MEERNTQFWHDLDDKIQDGIWWIVGGILILFGLALQVVGWTFKLLCQPIVLRVVLAFLLAYLGIRYFHLKF